MTGRFRFARLLTVVITALAAFTALAGAMLMVIDWRAGSIVLGSALSGFILVALLQVLLAIEENGWAGSSRPPIPSPLAGEDLPAGCPLPAVRHRPGLVGLAPRTGPYRRQTGHCGGWRRLAPAHMWHGMW